MFFCFDVVAPLEQLSVIFNAWQEKANSERCTRVLRAPMVVALPVIQAVLLLPSEESGWNDYQVPDRQAFIPFGGI